MLKEAIRENARKAIQARFQMRDEILDAELKRLADQAESAAGGDETAKVGVRLRLVCEHDLFERSQMVWLSLKRAHQDNGAPKSPTLMQDLFSESQLHMKEASLNLAASLEKFAAPFQPFFSRPGGLDARWLAGLRGRALERYSADMEEYVAGVRWGISSLVASLREGGNN